ncbi:hypothetical protein D3C85_1776380 [compost metagenome]
MQRLPGLFGIERSHAGPMVGPKYDDLLVGQLRQHAPNVTASNTEHLRQAFFGKATARLDALFENGIEDPRVEINRGWFPVACSGKGQGAECLR